MLGRIIDAALKQRLLVFLGALALAVWRFGRIEDRWAPSRERV